MNGLSHVAGVGPRVTVNGKDYQVRGKTNRFYAELEAELLKLRGDPFDMIVEAAKRGKLQEDPELLRRVVVLVVNNFRNWRVMTYDDYIEFSNSPTGDAFTVWHCLKQDAPDLNLDDVKHTLVQMRLQTTSEEARKKVKEELEKLFKAIEVASGEDQLGNSNGRPLDHQVPALTTGT